MTPEEEKKYDKLITAVNGINFQLAVICIYLMILVFNTCNHK